MVTVAFPYLLTLVLGVPFLRLAALSGRSVLHGIGIVHTLLPVASLTGDYYEMGSIILTRLFGIESGSSCEEFIRGDDLFLVISRINESGIPNSALIVLPGFLLGALLVVFTLDLSIIVSRLLVRKPLANCPAAV